eukprot:172304-Hanusia_phi.AAC.1
MSRRIGHTPCARCCSCVTWPKLSFIFSPQVLGVQQQRVEGNDRVERRAEFVADVGEEATR